MYNNLLIVSIGYLELAVIENACPEAHGSKSIVGGRGFSVLRDL